MRLVDRLRGRSTQPKVGAGAAELVEMLAERDAYASDDDPIRSLGFFVWTLRRRARAERRHAAGKPPWTEKHLLDRHGNPTVVRNDWHDERADRLGPARAAAAERKFRGRPRGSSC